MKTLQERLKHARKLANMTQAQLARASGVSQSTIAQIESGRNQATKFIHKLSKALPVGLYWLMTGTGPVEGQSDEKSSSPLTTLEKLDQLSPEWIIMDMLEPVFDTESREIYWGVNSPQALSILATFFEDNGLKLGECKLMLHKGNSMEPFLFNDDWIMIDTNDRSLEDSAFYLFLREDGEHFVNQVIVLPNNNIRLHNCNFANKDFDLTRSEVETSLRILGRIVYRATGHRRHHFF